MQSMSIRVDLKSFTPPQVPYDVQCFMVARSDLDGTKYIYEVHRKSSAAQFDTILFPAGPVTGTGKKWVSIPRSDLTTSGQPVSALPIVSKGVKGTKYYGWIVRVVSNEMAVRHESNQPELKLAAEKTPAAFDLAVAAVKE